MGLGLLRVTLGTDPRDDRLHTGVMNFFKVLVQLDRFFRERGMDYAVVGAFALHAFGIARATADLDLVVESSAQRPLLAFLEGLGYETLHVSPGYSNHVHPLGVLGRVDFLYLGGNTAREVFKGATPRLTLRAPVTPCRGRNTSPP